MAAKRILTYSSDGRWRKQIAGKVYYFGRGKSKSDTKSYKQAEQRYFEFMQQREVEQPIEVPMDSLSLGDAAEKFLQHQYTRLEIGEITPTSFDRFRCSLEQFVKATGEERLLSAVGELDLTQYRMDLLRLPVSERTGKPISPRTAKVRLEHVRAFFAWSYQHSLMDRLPRNIVGFTKVRLPPPEIRIFTLDELNRLWDAAPSRTRLFMALGLNCGYGQQDIADLQRAEVDLDKGVIERRRSKTGIYTRHALWPLTCGLLRSHCGKKSEPTDLCLTSANGEPLVYERIVKGKLRRTDAIRNAFWRIQRQTGIQSGRGFYCLRKTAATEVEKIDPWVTEMFLGHSERGMRRHYVERDWDRLDRAILQINVSFCLEL